MLVSQVVNEICFNSYSYKESYVQAMKYLSSYVKYDNITFKLEKQKDGKSIKLIIYYTFDEKQLAAHRCTVCKEFHHSFFINEENNCEVCRMKAYRKELALRIKSLAKVQQDKFKETQ